MDKRHCRQAVKARAYSYLRQSPATAAPMRPPENKPDVSVEDAERPDAGKGTKTAELVKSAVSAALLANARNAAAARADLGKKLLKRVSKLKASGKALSEADISKMKEVMNPRDFKKLESSGFDLSRAQMDLNRTIGRAERQSNVFVRGGSTPTATMGGRIQKAIKVRGKAVTPQSIESVNASGPLASAKTQARAAAVPEATVAPVFENRPPTAIAPAATQNIRKRGPLPSPAEAEAQTAAFVPKAQQRAPSVSAQPRAQTPATPAQAVAAPAAQAPAASQWSMGQAQAPAASQWSMGQVPAQAQAAKAAPVSPGPVAPPSNRATQTYVGGMPVPSAAAEGTMSMAAVNPQRMSRERAQQLVNANPQLQPQAPANIPPAPQAPAAYQIPPAPPAPQAANGARPALGRQIAVFGTAVPAGVLAASMANRPMGQQQQQQPQY
jgi:hypothetical protein